MENQVCSKCGTSDNVLEYEIPVTDSHSVKSLSCKPCMDAIVKSKQFSILDDFKTVETLIPFSGFYESIHSWRLDDLLNVGEDSDLPRAELEERIDQMDWKTEHENYSKAYVAQMSKMLGIELEFVTLDSPKFYNFSTDRIFAKIKQKDVQALQARLDLDKMNELVKEKFTSRAGFISHYAADYSEWQNQPALDHNQIGTIIECILIQEEGDSWEDWTIEHLYI